MYDLNNEENLRKNETIAWWLYFICFIVSILCLKNSIIKEQDLMTNICIIASCILIINLLDVSMRIFVTIIIMNIDLRIVALLKLVNKYGNITLYPEEYKRFVSEEIDNNSEDEDE